MKPPKPIKAISDVQCSHCVFYRTDYKPDYSTCHLSMVAFETVGDNYCADGMFVWHPPDGDVWTLNFQDAILKMLSVKKAEDEE